MLEFMSDPELKAAQEARQQRKSELRDLISRAGLNPAEIDVTKLMSDEEQQKLIADMVAERERKDAATKEAEKLGRKGLREKFRQTVQHHGIKTNATSVPYDREALKKKLEEK